MGKKATYKTEKKYLCRTLAVWNFSRQNQAVSGVPNCGARFSSEAKIAAHFGAEHQDAENCWRPFACNFVGCSSAYVSKQKLHAHQKKCKAQRASQAQYADARLSTCTHLTYFPKDPQFLHKRTTFSAVVNAQITTRRNTIMSKTIGRARHELMQGHACQLFCSRN